MFAPSTQAEAGESEVQGHPQQCGDLEAILGYVSPCLKTEKEWGRREGGEEGDSNQAQIMTQSLQMLGTCL